jgi:hypothetical protein
MATSLASRKFDLFLAIFLTIHGFCVTFIDCLDLYPTSLQPAILQHVRHFYIETFQDRFMTEPPRWFVALTWFELLYHLPTCLWSIPALVRGEFCKSSCFAFAPIFPRRKRPTRLTTERGAFPLLFWPF